MTKLRIGDQSITLEKSSKLVGLRARKPPTDGLESAAAAQGGRVLSQRLGGFQLIEVDPKGDQADQSLNEMRRDSRVDVGTHVYHTSADGVPFVPTGELFLVFKPDATLEACNKVLDQYKLQVVQTRGPNKLIARVTALSPNPVKVAEELQSNPVVEIAEPDLATPGRLANFEVPHDEPLLQRQWHLRNSGEVEGSALGLTKGADARVLDAWIRGKSLGSSEVTVAVIDDGFDLVHPDFSGASKIVSPWDFTRNTDEPYPDYSNTYPYWNGAEWVGDWHGTACAGVAVASANGSGLVGVAPGCRLMPVRWGVDISDRQIEAWFGYVAAQGAAVVSCSWSAQAQVYALPTRSKEAITLCATQGRGGRGCIICFAAGNESADIDDPPKSLNGFAIHPDVVAVAASTSRDEQSDYSNYGAKIAVCAPSSGAGGRGITTADVTGTFSRDGKTYQAGYNPGAYTDSFGGTSSATPVVAGVCALILSVRPELTAAAVKEIIIKTARKIGHAAEYDQSGHSRKYGYGCVDADAALALAISGSQ